MSNYNPMIFRLPPIEIVDEEYMKARIRQDKDFVNNIILNEMARNPDLLPTLLQQAQVTQNKDRRGRLLVYDVTLFVVPAEQVRVNRPTPEYIPGGWK